MALAKTIQPEEQAPVATIQPQSTGVANYEWEGVPIDVFRHFSVELGAIPTKDIEQLKDITNWAKSQSEEEPTIGNILHKIRVVQSKLGTPSLNEKSYSKVYQFIKMQRVIDEMTKRQDSLRGTRWV